MSKLKKICIALIASGTMFGALPALAEIVVIVSAKSAATALTEEQASDVFLGKNNTLPGGVQAVPLDQTDGTALREQFYSKVSGKTSAQMKAYWSKQIFTGKGQPPKEGGDSAAVRTLVAANPNIVGYIDKSVVDGSVKVVLTLK